jgi:hypothetical protein
MIFAYRLKFVFISSRKLRIEKKGMRLDLFIILLASANAGFRAKRDFGDIDVMKMS